MRRQKKSLAILFAVDGTFNQQNSPKTTTFKTRCHFALFLYNAKRELKMSAQKMPPVKNRVCLRGSVAWIDWTNSAVGGGFTSHRNVCRDLTTDTTLASHTVLTICFRNLQNRIYTNTFVCVITVTCDCVCDSNSFFYGVNRNKYHCHKNGIYCINVQLSFRPF